MNPSPITESLGWYGVIAILTAYALNIFGWLDARSAWYLALNLTGSFGIGADAYAQKNWQPVVLNAAWMIIAVIGIGRAFVG